MDAMRRFCRSVPLLCAVSVALALSGPPAGAAEALYANPNWNITLSDYGYSDFLVYSGDDFPPDYLHEMISGEWAAAISYDGIPLAGPENTMWLEPQFFYPTWISNSNFVVTEEISFPVDLDFDGLPEGHSVIENDDVRVRIEYDFEDTVTGTPIGVGGGQHVLSDRFVLRQRYVVTNLRPTTLTNVRLYQFLHGHPANDETNAVQAVYDPTFYPGSGSAFRYDTTNFSTNTGATDGSETGWLLEDHISFSSTVVPEAQGLGHYRGHVVRPETGLHVSVENGTLGGEATFGPDEVAGAERFKVSSLAPSASFTFEVQLAVRSVVHASLAVEGVVCVHMTDTGGDPTILLARGACGPAGPGGPYDVIKGSVEMVGGPFPFGFIPVIGATCAADEFLEDRITVSANLAPGAARFVLVRRGTAAQFDYGTGSSGEERWDLGNTCP